METGKPLISILMAVYEPRMDWLKEQLCSLNAQTYPNLRLYIRDDCSPTVSVGEIAAAADECITAFPYTIVRSEKNMGSDATFQMLTAEAEGEYFSYCDQDDVWLPEKLSMLQEALVESGAQMACSDMYIIDGQGRQMADSMKKVRRHHVFRSGEGLAPGLLTHNFASGCTMLLPARIAKEAIPFCPYMVHDHYLALFAAARGAIRSLERPLIRHRVHGGNQTGLLAGVKDKESYKRVRIDAMLRRLEWLNENFPCDNSLKERIQEEILWAKGRQQNWESGKCKGTVWKYRRFSPIPSVFEIFAEKMPERMFQWFLKLGKENKV